MVYVCLKQLSATSRSILRILDEESRIVGFGVPPPADEEGRTSWHETITQFTDVMTKAREALNNIHCKRDRRGKFRIMAVGISYGGGQKVSFAFVH